MAILDSLVREHMAQWAQYYALLEQQLGATATLLDIGGRNHKPSAATWTGRKFNASGLSPVWTPNEALSAFDTPFDLTLESNWLGHAPILTLNGTDEQADTPDNNYWSRDDTAAQGFSIGFWGKYVSGTCTALAKWESTAGSQAREWLYEFEASKQALRLYDESADKQPQRLSDSAFVTSAFHFFVATYDGGGGATAAAGITLYLDGAVDASTGSEQATYVGMENLGAVVEFGCQDGTTSAATRFWNGAMLGGPWSPFFVQVALTAAQIDNIYEGLRLGLGV